MERRALLHTNIIFAILLAASGCSNKQIQKQPEATVYLSVLSSDTRLARNAGIQYYDSLLFTGKITELFSNGDTAKITEFLYGKENGMQVLFYENHQIKEESFFVNGSRESEHKSWWENGNLKFAVNYKNDVFEGNFKGWNESGFLVRDFNYKDGQEVGLQRAWFSDGKPQMNYVVKNNRKYGLTGVKNCLTENEK